MQALSEQTRLFLSRLVCSLENREEEWTHLLNRINSNEGKLLPLQFAHIKCFFLRFKPQTIPFDTFAIFKDLAQNKTFIRVTHIQALMAQCKSQQPEVFRKQFPSEQHLIKEALSTLKNFMKQLEDPKERLAKYAIKDSLYLTYEEYCRFLNETNLEIFADAQKRKMVVSNFFKDRKKKKITEIQARLSINTLRSIQNDRELIRSLSISRKKSNPKSQMFNSQIIDRESFQSKSPQHPKIPKPMNRSFWREEKTATALSVKYCRESVKNISLSTQIQKNSQLANQKLNQNQNQNQNQKNITKLKLTENLEKREGCKVKPFIVPQKIQFPINSSSLKRQAILQSRQSKTKKQTTIELQRIQRKDFALKERGEPQNQQKMQSQNSLLEKDFPSEEKQGQENCYSRKYLQSKVPLALKYYQKQTVSFPEMCCLQELQRLLAGKKKYADPTPPWTDIGEYVSVTDIFEEPYELFESTNSRAFLQNRTDGEVQDCYFRSIVMALSKKNSKPLKDLFILSANPAEYFAIRLFIDGGWKIFTTDAQFPCRQGKNHWERIIYTKPNFKQIWLMLLEKCWAKKFGGYKAIKLGTIAELFNALTGAPTQVINFSSTPALLNFLIKIGNKSYTVAVSGNEYLKNSSKQEQQDIGLVSHSCYCYVKTVRIKDKIIIKLQNPWGEIVWRKKWGFSSSEWTDKLRQDFNYFQKPQDGSFYMQVEDFFKYFNTLSICKMQPHSVNTFFSLPYLHSSYNYYLRLKVSVPGKYNLCLYQRCQPIIGGTYKSQTYSVTRLFIQTYYGQKLKYFGSKMVEATNFCDWEGQFAEGTYLITISIDCKHKEKFASTLVSYGPGKVNFIDVPSSIQKQIEEELINSCCLDNQVEKRQWKEQLAGVHTEKHLSIAKGVGFVKVVNSSLEKKKIRVEITFQTQLLWAIRPSEQLRDFVLEMGETKTIGFYVGGSKAVLKYQVNISEQKSD